jgi:hypothetical protein
MSSICLLVRCSTKSPTTHLDMNTGNSTEYSVNQRKSVPKAQVWTDRIISILLALSLAIGGVIDVMKPTTLLLNDRESFTGCDLRFAS